MLVVQSNRVYMTQIFSKQVCYLLDLLTNKEVKMGKIIVLYLLSAIVTASAVDKELQRDIDGKLHRSQSTLVQFQKLHPCPSTGKTTGSCPGYTRDHFIPMACGGPDIPSNLMWSEHNWALLRDKEEWHLCRELKKLGPVHLNMPKQTLCRIIIRDHLDKLSKICQ
jgi:hypothetical protein